MDKREAPPDTFLTMPTYLTVELVRLIRREAGGWKARPGRGPGGVVRWPHVIVLACLADEGALAQREISDRMRIDPADLVGILDDLEGADFAVRRRDPADRRRYAVEITGEGRRFLRADLERLRERDARLFAALTPDETEQFRTLVRKVLAHHDPRFADAGGGGSAVP
ncbi:MarR family winged helix-turn-helix transcriptional regulator [Actinomadura rayongensis]|uniref:MarR family transcriptional regulator n=1 Tax=Actinomadura rayongensis TaxID=1429076 RepID=A0A6I4WKP1_9ACTN|nr:MarR family transcriptional regulator [Actinomadura rayongensis]MXQ67162.1 MarR family transcriptional regulator [Actinomadura rayongensis]